MVSSKEHFSQLTLWFTSLTHCLQWLKRKQNFPKTCSAWIYGAQIVYCDQPEKHKNLPVAYIKTQYLLHFLTTSSEEYNYWTCLSMFNCRMLKENVKHQLSVRSDVCKLVQILPPFRSRKSSLQQSLSSHN